MGGGGDFCKLYLSLPSILSHSVNIPILNFCRLQGAKFGLSPFYLCSSSLHRKVFFLSKLKTAPVETVFVPVIGIKSRTSL